MLLLAGCAAHRPAAAPAAAVSEIGPEIGISSFRATDGTELPLRRWLPKGQPLAVVVALHGFGDYSAAFRQPASFWAEHGIATFAFDQRGFGGAPHIHHWSGTATMADDAKAMVGAVRRLYPGVPVTLLGESMGGALAIVATTGPDPAPVDGVILVSPAVWAHDLMGTIERSSLWATDLTMPGLWLEPPAALGIHPSDNIEMLRQLTRDSLVQGGARVDTTAGLMRLMDQAGDAAPRIHLPTLVLFGAHEEVLPLTGVAAFLEHLPARNVTVAVYPHGYHMLLRDLDGPIVWRDVLAWLLDHRAPLPSGDACAGQAARSPPCAQISRPAGVPSGAGLR